MALLYNQCPKCNGVLLSNPDLIEGAVVRMCKPCKMFNLELDDRWFGTMAEVKARHKALDDVASRERAMFDSDISDPRWEQMA